MRWDKGGSGRWLLTVGDHRRGGRGGGLQAVSGSLALVLKYVFELLKLRLLRLK